MPDQNLEHRSLAPAALDQMSLAMERTYLAYERTLMAWIRTSISLITFGFTLYKFFTYYHDTRPGVPAEQWVGPRGYGILMIAVGVLVLAFSTFQYRVSIRRLRTNDTELPQSLALVLAGFIAVLGIFALGVAVVRG